MKKKTLYIALVVVSIILVSAYAIKSYIYKAHRDIATEVIDYEMQTTALSDVMHNSKQALKYIDKVVKTSGVITAVEPNSILIDDKVQVNFINNNMLNNLSPSSTIIIKGRCVGYDDLLEIVKIDQATIINQSK